MHGHCVVQHSITNDGRRCWVQCLGPGKRRVLWDQSVALCLFGITNQKDHIGSQVENSWYDLYSHCVNIHVIQDAAKSLTTRNCLRVMCCHGCPVPVTDFGCEGKSFFFQKPLHETINEERVLDTCCFSLFLSHILICLLGKLLIHLLPYLSLSYPCHCWIWWFWHLALVFRKRWWKTTSYLTNNCWYPTLHFSSFHSLISMEDVMTHISFWFIDNSNSCSIKVYLPILYPYKLYIINTLLWNIFPLLFLVLFYLSHTQC